MTRHELRPPKRLDKDVARMNRRLQPSMAETALSKRRERVTPTTRMTIALGTPRRAELSCRLRDERALYTIMGNGGGYGIIRARAA